MAHNRTNPLLSDEQRDLLWFISQGYGHETIGRAVGLHHKTVSHQSGAIISKLNARNIIHAVLLAYVQGLIGTYRDCGTRKAYLRHLRRNESTCPYCREANRRYVVMQRSQPQPPTLTETQIKIFTAFHQGARTLKEASDATGVKYDRIGSHVSVVYKRLRIETYPTLDRRRIALEMLRSQGVIV